MFGFWTSSFRTSTVVHHFRSILILFLSSLYSMSKFKVVKQVLMLIPPKVKLLNVWKNRLVLERISQEIEMLIYRKFKMLI